MFVKLLAPDSQFAYYWLVITAIKNKARSISSSVYWIALLLVGLLIIIFNDAFGEEGGFLVFSLAYFIILTLSVARWAFIKIKSVMALRRDKLKMEMLHLQSQVNPHFFFNMLNNLYGLIEKQPQVAKSMILKLSELMRYSIYEGQNERVSLEEEVAYLRNYVTLNQSRYHKTVHIDFKTEIEGKGYRIMPLLLILLVENAFKHGVEKLRNGAYVKIRLTAKNERIDFSITNNFDPEEVEQEQTGIGLNNLKRRLEIGYQKHYDLSLSQKHGIFQAHLSLDQV